MIVHCCHCSWCQRETGSAFVINAIVETTNLEVTGETEMVNTPSQSGRGQRIVRCPKCRVALWSHYSRRGTALAFIRVGTLDNPDAVPPDVHIFTSSKQPWVRLPDRALSFAESQCAGDMAGGSAGARSGRAGSLARGRDRL